MQVENIFRQYLYIQNVQVTTFEPRRHINSGTEKLHASHKTHNRTRRNQNPKFSSFQSSPLLCLPARSSHILSKLQNQSTGPCPTSPAKCNPEKEKKKSLDTQKFLFHPSLHPFPFPNANEMKNIKCGIVSHSFPTL
jgi:hypothetical protein